MSISSRLTTADSLAALLKPGDAVVAVAARAPCKDVGMMIENMVMTRAMVEALAHARCSRDQYQF